MSSTNAAGAAASSAPPELTVRLIDLLDTALEFHQRRASVHALDTFVRHLSNGALSINIELIRRFCALNPKEYVLSWEVKDSAAVGEIGIVKYGGFIFSLEVRARGKKETRLRKAKDVFEKASNGVPAQLPSLPTLGGRLEVMKSVDASQLISDNQTVQVPVKAVQPAAIVRSEEEPFDPNACLDSLVDEPYYTDQIVFRKEVATKEGRYASDVNFLAPRVKAALYGRWRVNSLYEHQAQAIQASLQGNDVLLLTGTGSGKTLCFASVVCQRFAELRGLAGDALATGGGFTTDSSSSTPTALFLYPTKALAQDQLRAVGDLFQSEDIRIRVIDGDSTPSEREDARLNTDVLLTNPDLLHVTILPNHATQWSSFLSRLQLIVIDEAHTFNGAFGCHVALCLRRLLRVLKTCPSFFMCSATISNPTETFYKLVGVRPWNPLVVVSEDTSPQGSRVIGLWRPPLVKGRTDGRRCSPIFETARLLSSMVMKGVRTLAFCKTRKLVELTLKYAYDLLKEYERVDLQAKVMAYRGGYTKQERRSIETKMFSGELLGIACTSALELGIDIGNCECVLVLGVSGAASTNQMFGRAGRKGRNALNMIVMFDSVLDHNVLKDPSSYLTRRAEESAVFDPLNEIILKKHLLCAARENPLDLGLCDEPPTSSSGGAAAGDEQLSDCHYFGGASVVKQFAKHMEEDDLLVSIRENLYRINPKITRPHDFSLRVVESIQIRLVCAETKQCLDEIEYSRAFFELYPGAIYLHQSKTYCILSLDLMVNREARAKRVDVNYYTSPQDRLTIKVTKVFETRGETKRLGTGVVRLTWNISSFCKRRFGMENFSSDQAVKDREQVSLPPYEYSTRATWLELGDDASSFSQVDSETTLPTSTNGAYHEPDEEEDRWGAGIHAAQHLLTKALGTLVLSHTSSISTTHGSRGRHNRLLIFDRDPGGIGIADAAYTRMKDCLDAAWEMVQQCSCPHGCLDCIFESACGEFNQMCNKQAAKDVLARARVVMEEIRREEGKGQGLITRWFTPKRIRRAKSLARERADGSIVQPMWKKHLFELGSEAVEFDHEL